MLTTKIKVKKELFIFMFISLLVQRNEPKKRQPVTWSDCVGLPGVYALFLRVLLEMTGSLKTRSAQTVQAPFSVISVVLGCVKRL